MRYTTLLLIQSLLGPPTDSNQRQLNFRCPQAFEAVEQYVSESESINGVLTFIVQLLANFPLLFLEPSDASALALASTCLSSM